MVEGTINLSVSLKAYRWLQELSQEEGESVTAVLERAIDQYHSKWFFERLEAEYKALQEDPEAWQAEIEERALWDRALADGLDPY